MNTLKYNKQATEEFLRLLDPNASTFTFQTFDDDKKRRNPKLVRVLHGSLDEHWDTLVRLNQQGAGIFVTVNETDGTGRKKENIIRIRAVFQEDDGDGTELTVNPHIIVQTSPGKHHRYVSTDTTEVDEFDAVQQRMVDNYGSDPSAKDIARVLRMPGFFHQKDPEHPHMVKLVESSGEPPLPWEKVKEAFPPVVSKKPKTPAASSNPSTVDIDEIKDALNAISPDCGYKPWLDIGMALDSTGHPDAFEVWNNWSKPGAKYEPGICEEKWDTFGQSPDGIGIGTLYYHAKQSGWIPKPSSAEEMLLDTYMYVAEMDLMYNRVNGSELKTTAFDKMYKHFKLGKKMLNPSTWFFRHPNAKKVENLSYLPGEEKKFVTHSGRDLYNTWKPSDAKLIPKVTDADVELWLKHVMYLIPKRKYRKHILDMFAWVVQHPDVKLNHGILLGGKPGIGKDMMLTPFCHAVGEHNVKDVTAEELKEKYMDYLVGTKAVVFQEVQNFDKSSIENKLKPILTAPPATLRLRMFGSKHITIPNRVFGIFMSNHKNALGISEGDRRYFALWSDADPKPSAYYTDLAAWLNDQGNDLVYSWLMNRDLSQFNPKSPAPATEYKDQVVEMGKTDLGYKMSRMLEDADVIFGGDIAKFDDIRMRVDPGFSQKYTDKAIRTALIDQGAFQCAPRRPKPSQERVSIWILRNQSKHRKLKPSELIEAWDKQQEVKESMNPTPQQQLQQLRQQQG